MRKGLLCTLLTLFLPLAFVAQASEADRIVGTWLTGNGKGKIQITRYGDKFGGKIVWLKEPNDKDGKPKVDNHNPDASKRNQPMMGLSLLLGFSYDGDGEYEDGTIYDPETGKVYKCIITLKGNDVLHVRGYIGFSLIGRTDTWTRVK